MPARVPLTFWRNVRYLALAVFLALVVGLVVRPKTSLALFWGLGVPVLPLVFLVAPGAWRNVCPLAAANQASRVRGVSKAATAPAWLRDYGFVVSTGLFFGFVFARKLLLNRSGPATAVGLVVVLTGAAAGGYFLKGKSGWCSSICPLLPVQRVYGQAPFVGVANAHCRPCLGCTKNCYDFNPRVGYLADMNDSDLQFRGYRRLFVAAFPGLVLGYFLVPDAGALASYEVIGRVLLWMAASVAVFVVIDTYARLEKNTLPPLFGAVAFGAFYWNGSVRVSSALTKVFGGSFIFIIWPVRVAALVLVAIWILRSRSVQKTFLEEIAAPAPVRVDISGARRARTVNQGEIEISFTSGESIGAAAGTSLLEVAEKASLSIPSGCRMGVCGADPVCVVEGFDNLSPIRREEADTLERLGLGGNNRMACVARVEGSCLVSLEPDRSTAAVQSTPQFTPDPDVRSVVIIGNGIAGVTVADFVRRAHPDCHIDIIGDEPHQLYNRMAIARLIHSRLGMQGLYLLPEDWYDSHKVTSWLNTRAVAVNRDDRTVRLGTGDILNYDRLVFATGGRGTVPPIEGFGLEGTFVLRDAGDGMRLRRHVQQLERRVAFVAGGGLLGLEAAHALHQLGLKVTVAERSDRLLRRPLDPAASDILRAYFEDHGIGIATNIEIKAVRGQTQLEEIVTVDDQVLPCDVLLVAAGVTPNSGIAQNSGVKVGKGILVDAHLRTDDPSIYAVGDVAEFDGQIWGLWPVAVQQARIAATNIAGGEASYDGEIPVTLLKGVGLDMLSFGRVEPRDGDIEVIERANENYRYRKIVVADRRIVGGVFLGEADVSVSAQAWYDEGREIDSAAMARLTEGDWSPLTGT